MRYSKESALGRRHNACGKGRCNVRALPRDGKIMFGVNLSFSVGMGLYSFVMPAYVRQLGATPAQYGAMLSALIALGTLTVIPGGAWADRYDRRLLMIIGWAMCLPAPIVFAHAPTWLWLLAGYIPFFLSFFCNPAINAYIANLADHASMGTVWGLINAAFPLGFIVGPALGSVIIRAWGMTTTFYGTFICYLVSFGLLFMLGRDNASAHTSGEASAAGEATRESARAATMGRDLLVVASLFAGFHLIIGVGQNYIAMYLEDTAGLALSSLSYFGSAGAIGGFILGPWIGRLRDRRGAGAALPVSLGLVAAAYAGLLAVRLPIALFGLLVMRGGENGMFSLGQAEVSARAPRASLGRVFALFNVMTGVAGTAGPYLGGVLYGMDVRLPFLTVIGGSVLIAVASRLAIGSGTSGIGRDELGPAQDKAAI